MAGKFASCLAVLDDLVVHHGNATVHLYRGAVLQRLGRTEDALASYVEAATLAPSYAAGVYVCARSRMRGASQTAC